MFQFFLERVLNIIDPPTEQSEHVQQLVFFETHLNSLNLDAPRIGGLVQC